MTIKDLEEECERRIFDVGVKSVCHKHTAVSSIRNGCRNRPPTKVLQVSMLQGLLAFNHPCVSNFAASHHDATHFWADVGQNQTCFGNRPSIDV